MNVYLRERISIYMLWSKLILINNSLLSQPYQDALLETGYQVPVSLPYQSIPSGGVPASTAEMYALVSTVIIPFNL